VTFPITSRYSGTSTATLVTDDGRILVYLTRRFVPAAGRFAFLQWHTVTDGERLDQIANQYLGDPLLFWRICDANNALDPDELIGTPGRRLRITLPEGIPSTPTDA
jgi:hypothetical protein